MGDHKKIKSKKLPNCAQCRIKDKICIREDGRGPDFCPTINLDKVVEASLSEYQRPEIKEFAL